VLVLVADGLSNAEICERLCVSLPTTKSHVASILTKLECRDRVQAAILAHRVGATADHPSTPSSASAPWPRPSAR
jgi:DNA-binding NarL/FixJ family response regulator